MSSTGVLKLLLTVLIFTAMHEPSPLFHHSFKGYLMEFRERTVSVLPLNLELVFMHSKGIFSSTPPPQKTELFFLLSITRNFVVSVRKGFLFL